MKGGATPARRLSRGAAVALGAMVGAGVAAAYGIVVLGLFVAFISRSPSTPREAVVLVVTLGLATVAVVGVLPAAVLGAVTGAGLCLVLNHLRGRLTSARSAAVGALFGVAPAAALSIATAVVRAAANEPDPTGVWASHVGGYVGTFALVWIGPPAVLEVLATAWLAWALYRRLLRPSSGVAVE